MALLRPGRPLVLALLLAPTGAVAADPAVAPFSAWLNTESAYVHARPDMKSPPVGLLRLGDVVSVTSCVPDCAAKTGWAVLGDAGAIRLSLLQRANEDDTHRALSASARYVYGTVRADDTPLYASPGRRRPAYRVKAGRVLAFRTTQPREADGWLQTADGAFVRASAIRPARPSSFRGAANPSAVTAFTLRKTPLFPPLGQAGPPQGAERHSSWEVVGLDQRFVQTPQGLIRRSDVRLASTRARPPGIPATARWVHVDLNEQALTAYEGDRLVFATLVSTGKKDHETPKGIFKVWMKTVHHRMSGTEPVPYDVDEVPFTQFIHRGVALHGAFWHDAFGFVVSHGCINLAMADAEWLFDWAPPKLPEGWHAAMPGPTGAESLYVVVEESEPMRRWQAPVTDPITLQATPP